MLTKLQPAQLLGDRVRIQGPRPISKLLTQGVWAEAWEPVFITHSPGCFHPVVLSLRIMDPTSSSFTALAGLHHGNLSNNSETWILNPSCCHCSVVQLYLTLCDPMDCSTPGLPILHHLLEFAQIHVHRVGDAIQPSHPLPLSSPLSLIFPSITSFPVSQLFTSLSIGASVSASVLSVTIQGWLP